MPNCLLRLKKLEELDIGWVSCDGLGEILKQMSNLKKLFLSANRNIRDEDLSVLADYCVNLEQLDFVGNNFLTADTLKVWFNIKYQHLLQFMIRFSSF